MAKSKSPRKAYDPTRWSRPRRVLLSTDVEEIKSVYRNVELAVEFRLHTGEFTRADVLNLCSFMILATFVMYRGYGLESHFVVGTYGPEWIAFQSAVGSFKKRSQETGSYTVTGDELKAIRDGMELAGTFIEKALDTDPDRVAELWILTEMSNDMPSDAVKGLKWMDRKLREIRRWRRR